QRGKGRRETFPDGEYLCGEVRAGRQPDRLGQLIEGIHEQEVREVQDQQLFYIHSSTPLSFTLTFSRSSVLCSTFCAACSLACASRSRMDGFSSRLILWLANS